MRQIYQILKQLKAKRNIQVIKQNMDYVKQDLQNWKSLVNSFPSVIIDLISQKLNQNGYTNISYLQKGVQGEILKAYSNNDSKFVQINIQQQNKNEYQSIKDQYDSLIALKDTQYIVKYLRMIYFEDIFIAAIVSECYSTTLKDEMQSLREKGSWFQDEAISLSIINLCLIVQELHLNQITHYNLEPSKIVKQDDGLYKINDLSLYVSLKIDKQAAISYLKSSSRYGSPELDQMIEKGNVQAVNEKSDVFSMALIIFEVLGYPIDDIIIKQIQNGHFTDQQIVDGFRFKQLQKLLIDSFFSLAQEKRIESYEIVHALLPLLPLTQQGLNKVYNQLEFIVKKDPYSFIQNVPFIQKARAFNKLAQIIVLNNLPNSQKQDVVNSELEASDIFFELGDAFKSLELRLKALSYYQQTQPNNNLKLAQINTKIASSYMKSQDYNNTLKYAETGFLQSIEAHKGDSINGASCLYMLSWCYFGLNDLQKALDYGQRSLEMKKKVYPQNDLQIAVSLSFIGSIYDKLNQIDVGLQYKLEALDIRQYQFNQGNKSAYVHLIYSNIALGSAYIQMKEYQTALNYHMQAYELRKMIYGLYHQDTVESLQRIKYIYTQINKDEVKRVQQEIDNILSNPKYRKTH
ncbi:protein kinase (macronuclear) [Tetrahymena thermophila SB210]|uniref:Protein kinase n=1 Tax=Tetrahymena thermophila (strain SB210) TaxID=312017 RepID=Q22N67_TETTS|nr:protein kinase [Tetrahymena thermophila SB210]EAR86918.2 protein kinase [Tetrahymena thermophila SB210]|eukprot:XP_001007163.2 protein kinase [Tetrahymena thermophila SB210]